MARRTTVEIEDDLDGGPAEVQVTFTLDRVQYEIDLSSDNAQQLRDALSPYIRAGRRIGGRQRSKPTPTGNAGKRATWLSEVRDWATAHGHEVAARGRVPQRVVDAYTATHE